jgi:hypothetical protein
MSTTSIDDINQINSEFHDIGVEVRQLLDYLNGIGTSLPDPASQQYWQSTHICSSAVEKIYMGLERIMWNIATRIDGEEIGKDGGWHQILLLRMANSYPNIRGPVISKETYDILDNIRGFRHRERNSYTSRMDLSIVIERCKDAIKVVGLMEEQIQVVLEPIQNILIKPPGT